MRAEGACFRLRRGASQVLHGTVDEFGYILAGRGEVWRSDDGREEVVALKLDLTSFQFRATGGSPLSAFAVTMPP